jgi:hypothetical protein
LKATGMKRLLSSLMLLALVVVPYTAQAQSIMSTSMIGVGPHGYDWLIGTWTCTNSAPSAMAGPAIVTLRASRGSAGNALLLRSTGTNFDSSGYLIYASNRWWSPSAFADGGHESESTVQIGNKAVWTGSYFSPASGKSMQVRDTYISPSLTKYTDLGEYQTGGTWKKLYSITCIKKSNIPSAQSL